MTYKIFPPADELKKIVKHFIVIDSFENSDNFLFLPNGGNFIIFNKGVKAFSKSFCDDETFVIPKSYSVSPKTDKVKNIIIDSSHKDITGQSIIVVELLPVGFYKLFNMNASELSCKYMEISNEIVDKHLSKLYTHNSIEDELSYLNNSFIEMQNCHCNTHLCIEDVVERIYNEYFDIQVKDLLAEFGCSRSTMERQFKKIVGYTPKKYILIAKFCKTFLEYVEDKRTFHELQYIYSDNSHMNTLFKNTLGMSPSEIFSKVENKELYVYQINNLKQQAS